MTKPTALPTFNTPQGILLIALNFVLTAGVAIAVITLLNQSKTIKAILFGKLS